MIDSKIEWCDDTVNVVEGCEQVDEDCRNCYAMGIAARFAQPQVTARRESDGAPMETKPGHYDGLARLSLGRRLPQWTGKVRLRPDVLDAMFWRLLRARSPRRQFLCSMGDIFHREVPDAFLDEVFARIAILVDRRRGPGGSHVDPHPIYMLTKRPDRAAEYTNAPEVAERIERAARTFINRERVAGLRGPKARAVASMTRFAMPAWPLRSVALITSAGTQAGADARVPWILRCKAAVRGVSCEPMTGPVDFSRWIAPVSRCKACEAEHAGHVLGVCPSCGRDALITVWGEEQLQRLRSGVRYADDGPHARDEGQQLQWVIVGGESGDLDAMREELRPRPCELAWIESVVEQGRAAGVPVFVKQLGNVLAAELGREGKGGSLEDLPSRLRVRQFPRMGAA